MTRPLVSYEILHTPPAPVVPASLYSYEMAGNGVFLRAERAGIAVRIPISPATIRGLTLVEPFVELRVPRVPATLLQTMLDQAREAVDEEGQPVEILFHLYVSEDTWYLALPPQRQSAGSVIVEAEPPPDYPASEVLLELHSHHTMTAYFSGTDDADEQGFRLYAVLGTIDQQPSVRLRVGVYGYFAELPITTVFEPVPGVVDAREHTTRRPLPVNAIRHAAPTHHPLPAFVQRWRESEWGQRLSALLSGGRKDPS